MIGREVLAAFEILLEEIEMVINTLKGEGAVAVQKSEYDKAKTIIEKATALEKFREKVKQLQNEWQSNFSSLSVKPTKKRKIKSKLKKGLRTPEDDFRIPILEALVELGGSASVSEVLELVEKKMKNKLNEYDYQILPSNNTLRWKNAAQWCRNTLMQEGLLKSDSPKGIWEITEKGVRHLKEKNWR
jgi:FtsZ-binding cell division protein ZapB